MPKENISNLGKSSICVSIEETFQSIKITFQKRLGGDDKKRKTKIDNFPKDLKKAQE